MGYYAAGAGAESHIVFGRVMEPSSTCKTGYMADFMGLSL